MEKMKVGVVGAGIGRFHGEAFLRHPDVNKIVIIDINDDARGNLVAELEKQCSDAKLRKKIIGESDFEHAVAYGHLDAISICTPNCLHHPMVMAAIAKGIPVLCEKPPAMSAKECATMIRAARRAGVILMFDFNNRFRPISRKLKEIIDSGELGRIYDAHCCWVRRRGIPSWGRWFTQEAHSGGGPIVDLGVHMLDLAFWFMGNPKPNTVLSISHSQFGKHKKGLGPWGTADLEKGKFDVSDLDRGMILLRGNRSLSVDAAWAGHFERERVAIELRGTDGGAIMERTFVNDGDDTTSVDTLKVFCDRGEGISNEEIVMPEDPAMGRHAAASHFIDCVIDPDRPRIVVPQDGLRVMTVLDAFRESVKTKQAVAIP